MAKIEVKNLKFNYTSDRCVLNGISLKLDDVPTAIIGQNGAGKTTFVKILKGLLKPSSGEIWIKGKNIKDFTVAQLAAYIGLVFQNPNDQIFKNKVIDEVCFGPLNIGMNETQAMENAYDALSMLGIENLAYEHPYDLNFSERKLIAIASVVAMDTSVIILDEPTIAQDYRNKEKIKALIHKLYKKGKLVITIIHDMDFVAECFDRTIVFSKGKILMDGCTRMVFSKEEILCEAGVGIPHITQLSKSLGYHQTYLTPEEFISIKKRFA